MMKNNKPCLFISRSLNQYSELIHSFPHEKYAWHHRSLIEINSLPFKVPTTQWLFFYSKNGIECFEKGIEKDRIQRFKIACFGPGTAQRFEEIFNKKSDFIGTGERDSTLNSFEKVLGTESICFVRGRESQKSIQTILNFKDKITHLIIKDKQIKNNTNTYLIVYDNHIKTTETLGQFEVAILTSPMNAKGFFKNKGMASLIISIGPTTTLALEKLQSSMDQHFSIETCEHPSEKDIIKILTQKLS